jgi:hypothetical protein
VVVTHNEVLRCLSSEPRADHSLKSLYLGLWHLVTAGEVMSREQEYMLNACFLPRLQQALCTTLGWTEQSKCIRNSARLILRYRSGIVRFFKFEAGFPEPTKICRARIIEEGLTLSEPAPHPPQSHLGIGPETESDHEYHWEAGQGTACPPGPFL